MVNIPINLMNKIYSIRGCLENNDIRRSEFVSGANREKIIKIIVTKEKLLFIVDAHSKVSVDVYKYEDSVFKYERSYSETLWEV